MGCGSSKSTGAFGATLTKDPSDFTVPEFKLQRVKIDYFDDFFKNFEVAANKVVDMSNGVNDSITDVKDECASLLGAYKVKLTSGVASSHRVLLALTKADGSAADPKEVDTLLSKPDIASADTALATALAALHTAIQADSSASLAIGANGLLEGGPAGHATAVNAAIGNLVALLPGHKVVAFVRTAAAPGATTFVATLEKPVYMNVDDDKPTMRPVTLLDVYKTANAQDITSALGLVAEQAAAIAAASKNVASSSLAVKGKKLVGTATDADEEKAAAYKKAVAGANIAVFKLFKACATIYGDVSVPRAVEAVLVSLARKVKSMGGDISALRIDPKLSSNDETGEIDFKMGVTHPSIPDLSFPECLPGAARNAYNTVLAAVETAKGMVPKFEETKVQFTELVEESKKMAESPADKLKEADLDLMAMGKALSTITRNSSTILGSASLPATFALTVKRLADELRLTVEKVPTLNLEALANQVVL